MKKYVRPMIFVVNVPAESVLGSWSTQSDDTTTVPNIEDQSSMADKNIPVECKGSIRWTDHSY